jgi:hypothetical protein
LEKENLTLQSQLQESLKQVEKYKALYAATEKGNPNMQDSSSSKEATMKLSMYTSKDPEEYKNSYATTEKAKMQHSSSSKEEIMKLSMYAFEEPEKYKTCYAETEKSNPNMQHSLSSKEETVKLSMYTLYDLTLLYYGIYITRLCHYLKLKCKKVICLLIHFFYIF